MPAQAEQKPFELMEWSNPEQPLALFERQIRVDATSKLRQFYYSSPTGQLTLVPRSAINNPKAPQGHSLNLKKWLQEIGVPPWRRQGMPLLTLRQSHHDLVLAPMDQQHENDWVLFKEDVA
jgi:tRNA(Ile)-lysidine synthetase-like protein